jgi:hypothetical protein
MPNSLDSILNELDSRLRKLKREDGHVFMLDAFHRQFCGVKEEPASAESPSATAASTQAPRRFLKTSRGRSLDAPGRCDTHPAGRDSLR